MEKNVDVIVVGGGHAGIEASSAIARYGCKVLLITSERQILHSKKALSALKRINKLSIIEETELVAEELRLASKHISNITSLIDNEDVLDKIFSTFCIGK